MLQRVLVIIVLAALAGHTSAICPSGCTCNPTDTDVACKNLGLEAPPPGFWPDIKWLDLASNNISSLELYSLLGFPNLIYLTMEHNPIRVLDLNVFTMVKQMYSFRCNYCKIERVIHLTPGSELPNIWVLSLIGNQMTAAPDITGLTHDRLTLDLSHNPIIFPGDSPLLTSETLAELFMDGTDGSTITAQTFTNLPNLNLVSMKNSNLENVSDVFVSLPNLKWLMIGGNKVKVIGKQFLSENQHFERIMLSDGDLEELSPAGLKGLVGGGILYIDNTPLACDCKYEALYWWAKYKRVLLYASCGNNPSCEFTDS